MYLKVLQLIQIEKFTEALKVLKKIAPENEYGKHVGKLLAAEIALGCRRYKESLRYAREVHPFFSRRKELVQDLQTPQSDLRLDSLELCFLFWVFARALEALCRYDEALAYCFYALKEWELYQLARKPFLSFEPPLKNLGEMINKKAEALREKQGYKFLKQQMLDMLVPDGFLPKPFLPKLNGLKTSKPLVSVCIASYRDGPWLKRTVDAVLAHAGYDRFEIVLFIQKDTEEDDSARFLEDKKYAKNPKIKPYFHDKGVGSERAKDRAYRLSKGELVVSIDAHIIPCKDFIGKTVQLFVENPEISLLSYGLVVTNESEQLHYYHYSEIPVYSNAIIMIKPLVEPEEGLYYKPGIYIRQTLVGTFCITRSLYEEVGGYLVKDYSWGDKALGLQAYLYGYTIYYSKELACIHKWHQEAGSLWRSTQRITSRFQYESTIPLGALICGYFFYSKKYFEEIFIPWVKKYTGEEFFLYNWDKFKKLRPTLSKQKKIFWKNAVRSVREYWYEYWDFIWARLTDEEKERFSHFFVLNDEELMTP